MAIMTVPTPSLILWSRVVPASASSLIAVLAGHIGPVGPDPEPAPDGDLLVVLRAVPDPRQRRGQRHRLVTVLAVSVAAVLAGARSYVAIAEWAQDLPPSARVRLGIGRRAPSESTIRRVLQLIDLDALDIRVVDVAGRVAACSFVEPAGISQSAGIDRPSGRGRRQDRPRRAAPGRASSAHAGRVRPDQRRRPGPVGCQKSRSGSVACGDRQPGMITNVSLRLLYLIFKQLLTWLTLLPAHRRPRTSSSSSCATRSPYSAEPTQSPAWTGPTEPSSPP